MKRDRVDYHYLENFLEFSNCKTQIEDSWKSCHIVESTSNLCFDDLVKKMKVLSCIVTGLSFQILYDDKIYLFGVADKGNGMELCFV
jgi:hypothetical protein